MIDIRLVRESFDEVRAALARRDPALVSELEALREGDQRRRNALTEVEQLKAERNRASQDVAERKREGQDVSSLTARLKGLSDRIKQLDATVRTVEDDLEARLLAMPNLPAADVPDGDASANRVLRDWGKPPSGPSPCHWEIGASLGVLDLPRGAKVAGSGFPLLAGDGARLVRGLVSFMLDLHTTEHGYREVWPPLLVNEEAARGTGQLPDLESNMYVTTDGYYLIPTAEVPVTNLHRDEILAADRLPIGYAAYTPCFRREAGAAGKDTRGLLRVHQFDKVELVRFATAQTSAAELDVLLGHAEEVLRRLELAYRVVELAAGDLGFASARTFDLEVYAAGVGKWLEVSSVSSFTDFQARRAGIRYRPRPDAKPEFVHTLNGSGVAIPRTLAALLENNVQADGTVRLPEALVPYVGKEYLAPGGPA